MDLARRAAERAARTSYGRLLAILSAQCRDIVAAEDALADAFAAALRTWPVRGVPGNPDAWLLTAARNGIRNAVRHHRVADAAVWELLSRQIERLADDELLFRDERLKLLFVCAHPAIAQEMRTPLMLQTVLGLNAAVIAAAFLVSPATMSQRLVRSKLKIRDACIGFELPDADRLQERLADVLDAVYAAYGTGWDALSGAQPELSVLASEAIYLGRLLVELLPDEPEAKGLLSLMLYCEARRDARRDAGGRYVPLAEQDTRLWSAEMIVSAEKLLEQAASHATFGPYQCQAAIQSVHVQRAITGAVNHAAILYLYDVLAKRAPTIGVLVGQAAAYLAAADPAASLDRLDAVPADRIRSYQPYWAVRAHALAALCRHREAVAACEMAAGLSDDPAARMLLISRCQEWNAAAGAGNA